MGAVGTSNAADCRTIRFCCAPLLVGMYDMRKNGSDLFHERPNNGAEQGLSYAADWRYRGHTRRATLLIRRIQSAMESWQCDLDDVMIVMACWTINSSYHSPGLMAVQPANISVIAQTLKMPRETVRRRVHRLQEKQVLRRFAGGYVTGDDGIYRRILGVLGNR